MDPQTLCPCFSGLNYENCCSKLIESRIDHNDLEALMRSRFTAFVTKNIPYLQYTWHPETFPEELGEDEPNLWINLDIIDSDIDLENEEGEVEFKAQLLYDKKIETLHERSFFEKVEGRWVYHSGEFLNEDQPAIKIKANEPCPCKSGKLFKNCHG